MFKWTCNLHQIIFSCHLLMSSQDHQHPGNLKHVTMGVLHFQVQTQLTHSQAAREPSRYRREPSHHLWAGRRRCCLDKSHSLAAEKADRCTVYLLHHHRRPRQQHLAKKHQCEAGTNWKTQWKRILWWIYIHLEYTATLIACQCVQVVIIMSASEQFKTLWSRHTWAKRGFVRTPEPPLATPLVSYNCRIEAVMHAFWGHKDHDVIIWTSVLCVYTIKLSPEMLESCILVVVWDLYYACW